MLQLGVEEYQVGWICALSSEYATAKAMLDEQHEAVSRQDAADSNSYTLGRIHKHNLVIACLPAGVDGTDAAAIATTNLCRTFRAIRFGLMVGIGGGIPDLQKGRDIRLGDVVVSQPSGRNGGVVQYDKGKSHDGGRFELKGQLNRPPAVLLTALQNLRAEHDIGDSRIPEYLRRIVEQRPKMQKLGYSFPVQENDILRCAHNEAETSCRNCEGGKVKRELRQSTDPVIHYGVIASGNQVIKSAGHRDQLRDKCDGAICVEMEAAGLMDNFPCLVIRGICDYADSFKNDRWHKYAAATAAAFAKELLLYVSADQAGHERPITEIHGLLNEARLYLQDQKEHNQQQQVYHQRQETHLQQQEAEKIPIVVQALYGSQSSVHVKCHPGTRVDLLHQIQCWAKQPLSKPILWLNGKAGSGKSTISWTFADWLTNQDTSEQISLGASFFFKRGEGDRGSAQRLFPTIVRQLMIKIPGLNTLVINAIKEDPFIFDKALAEQFRQLILKPLQDQSIRASQSTFVVVIDALDECEKEADIRTILKLWSQLARATAVTLRLFLTSRSDLDVLLGFQQMSAYLFRDIDLMDAVPSDTIQQDLFVYLHDSLRSIWKDYNDSLQRQMEVDDDWPDAATIRELVNLADPLFIVASTICRFIEDRELNPRESLNDILSEKKIGNLEQMELTYLPILNHLTKKARDHRQVTKLHEEFRVIVGSIILLAEPLSIEGLATLLGTSPEVIIRRVMPLHSVMHIPLDRHTPIRTLHLSFTEFLLGERLQKQPFGIDSSTTQLALSNHCLRILNDLRENICSLDYPGKRRHELEPANLERCLSPAIQYACKYWVHHISLCGCQLEDDSEAHLFLRKHFLHWLEALSFMGRISEVIGLLAQLQSCVSESASGFSAFLEDARRFILAYRYIIDLAPLQLYSSAIIFTPENSLIRQIRGQETCDQIPSWIRLCPRTTIEWGLELQKLEGHSIGVASVAFSHNGSLLASASLDKTVRLWDPQTGREVQKLKGHSRVVTSVAFSHDGSLLASASWDRTVRLWDPQTGREVQELKGHSRVVTSVAFSHDGSLLASASWDRTVRLWDPQTGREVQELKGHSRVVTSVAFSHDGTLLASASWDRTVRLWDPQTGREVQKLKGHSNSVTSVAFSHDGSLLASGSDDQTVRLWDPQTGREVQKLKGHSNPITSVAFSHDGSLLASASRDETVRLWDPQTGRGVQKLEGHSRAVNSVAFSHDGTALIAGDVTFYSSENTTTKDSRISVLHDWVRMDDRDFLWLPHEYRGKSTAYGDKLAIGAVSGRVCIFQFDCH